MGEKKKGAGIRREEGKEEQINFRTMAFAP